MIMHPLKTSNPNLETAKRMLADFLIVLSGITALALACAAAIYTAIWLAS
jgi:hypothetical protein